MIKINYKSDFKINESSETVAMEVPFVFSYYVFDSKKYVVSFDGHNYVNCERKEDGSLDVIFNQPDFGIGHLKVERKYAVDDTAFADGVFDVVTVDKTDVFITSGKTFETYVETLVVPPYLKGDKGDPMTWSTMTETEREELVHDVAEAIDPEMVMTENEKSRQEAEQGRQTAEQQRSTTFNTLKGEMQSAITAGNAAAGNAQKVVNEYDTKVSEQDSKLSELGSKVRGVIQGETYNIIANEDWNSITGAFFKSSTYSRSELFKVRGKAILNSSDDSLLLSKGKVLTFSDALMLPSSLVKEYSSFGEYLSAGISKEEQYIMFFFQANYNKATEFVITFSEAAPSLEYVNEQVTKIDNQVTKIDNQVTKIDNQVTKTESLMHRQNNRLNFTTDVFDLSDFVLTNAELGSQYNSATKEVIIYGDTTNGIKMTKKFNTEVGQEYILLANIYDLSITSTDNAYISVLEYSNDLGIRIMSDGLIVHRFTAAFDNRIIQFILKKTSTSGVVLENGSTVRFKSNFIGLIPYDEYLYNLLVNNKLKNDEVIRYLSPIIPIRESEVDPTTEGVRKTLINIVSKNGLDYSIEPIEYKEGYYVRHSNNTLQASAGYVVGVYDVSEIDIVRIKGSIPLPEHFGIIGFARDLNMSGFEVISPSGRNNIDDCVYVPSSARYAYVTIKKDNSPILDIKERLFFANADNTIINAVGDSITQGQIGVVDPRLTSNELSTKSNNYPAILQEMLGSQCIVRNIGAGGAKISEIFARVGWLCGVLPFDITLSGSNKTAISSNDAPLTDNYKGHVLKTYSQGTSLAKEAINTVYVRGIECEFDYSESPILYIKRKIAVDYDLPLKKGTEIVFKGANLNKGIFVVFAGANGSFSSPDDLVDSIKHGVSQVESGMYIVIGSHTFGHEYNEALKKEFGAKFIDLLSYLTSIQSFKDIGYEPLTSDEITAERKSYGVKSDIQAIADGTLPPSYWRYSYTPSMLSKDDVHLSALGYIAVATIVSKRLKELNFLPSPNNPSK